ncbi:MAG: oxidoreductase [Calditrichaeota bacterium]|nr:MAG: oxidoreductase [Calditrichota bacterium]
MQQLIQNLKTGKMELLEVPFPALAKGKVLVRTEYSLISAGTEGSKVKTARSSLFAKARQKPEQVKQVLDSVKTEGIQATYQKVMNKLDAPAPLGYSAMGRIIEVGQDVTGLSVGDRVACSGVSAAHAEVIAVEKNLCVKVSENVKSAHAAYTTVASIALQGIRQADLRLGESCVVVGLGLIGQLTVQMLKAAGNVVMGIDIDTAAVELAKKSGADAAFVRNDETLLQGINEISGGYGVDSVIITAGTSSLDPVELAGKLCRRKGKVVIVGAVPTGFSRSNYYQKELELRMSSSYGPGRYDANYEEKGLDYPIGYVRWTENRNMQAYLELVHQDKLDIDLLTTHIFEFENALSAYDLILARTEPVFGVLLKYDTTKKLESSINLTNRSNGSLSTSAQTPHIGFIGAGSFAQKFLLPTAVKYGDLIAVNTASGNSSRNVADKFKFKHAVSSPAEVFANPEINTIFIATRHDSHAEFVLAALENGKNVFVEKPICLTVDALERIKTAYEKSDSHLMIGFNRRFAPMVETLVQKLGRDSKKAINYRINVGHIPADHWTQDPEIGGGRIIGEVCHFIDLCMYLSGSKPVAVSALGMDTALNLNDTLSVNLKFANGSIATISYFANGSKQLEKEYLEVYCDGMTAVIHDFSRLTIYGQKTVTCKAKQDKGHAIEVQQFLNAVQKGIATPIPFDELYLSSLLPFKILESLASGKTIALAD